MVTMAMGISQARGVFQSAMVGDLGVGRQVFGLASAISHLVFGVGMPFVGALVDRKGSVRVALVGAAVYVLGLIGTAHASTPAELYLASGLLIGLALSATTFSTAVGAVGRVVPAERRSQAFGLLTAGGSFGMFAMVPLAQALQASFGWRGAFLMLALVVAGVFLLALGLKTPAPEAKGGAAQSLGQALREAGGHGGYWLLISGYFVCGFHVAFIGTHLPAYLSDRGMSPTASAVAFSLIGLFNIIGAFWFGRLGDRWRKKYLLSAIYLARAAVIGLFLALPFSDGSAYALAIGMGFLWLGTVPLTSGLVAQIFGVRFLATLSGIVFFSHQVGSFLGAWLGGYAYDLTGSYEAVWLAAVALGLFAAVVHLPIADAPVARQARPAAA
ncbi:MAG: MFS transporter [Alphaproteobacteria bacterium]|nr:MFS transporter [Alphaproteobacteria bacterium]